MGDNKKELLSKICSKLQTYHFVAIVSFLTSSDRDERIVSDPALSQKNRDLPFVKRKRMDVCFCRRFSG